MHVMQISRTLTILVLWSLLVTPRLAAEPPSATTEPAAGDQYLLRYKFAAGETVRWKVVHLGTTETKIKGNTQTAKSRSVSTKCWRVTDVDDAGNMTFTHSVERVEMWQKLSDRPQVSYDSAEDEEAPQEYQHVAQTVGRPLTTVTIQPDGQVVNEGSNAPHLNLAGLGDMVMLLPPKPVRAGSRWYEPAELHVRHEDGRVERIKTRKRYTLKKVLTGVATIEVKTEVLTPVDDPKIESQLMQQLTNGEIRFDVDAGRILSRQIDWDSSVVGFSGADSMMKYLARFTEELLPKRPKTARSGPSPSAGDAETADTDSSTVRAASAEESVPRR
jgi:hypothetical protein